MIGRLPVCKVPYDKFITLGNLHYLLTYNPQVFTYFKGTYCVVLVEWEVDGRTFIFDKYRGSIIDMRKFAKSCNRMIESRLKRRNKC